VLDDCCESLGAEWGNEKLGIQADISAWSFDAGKVIIAGEGGMITTNNEDYYLLAREYSDHGHMNNSSLPRGRDTHRVYGFNYRMTELQAAVGIEQLKKLEYIVKKNRENYSTYENSLKEVAGLRFRVVPGQCNPLCDCLIFNFPNKEQASYFVKLLNEKGFGTKNVPDAIEWHFAKYWDHMFQQFGLDLKKLDKKYKKSSNILDCSVAIPIMVKSSEEFVNKASNIYYEMAKKTLDKSQ